jgi:hypothetical protein
MRNKEQKRDLSVQAIAGTYVVLLGMDLHEQDCPGLLGPSLMLLAPFHPIAFPKTTKPIGKECFQINKPNKK